MRVAYMTVLAMFAIGTSGCSDQPSGDGKPAPYVAGQPGFEALDNFNHNSDGSRVTNEDKALMQDAIVKFHAAEQRRKSGY